MSLLLAVKRPYKLITYARGTRSAQGCPFTGHSRLSAWDPPCLQGRCSVAKSSPTLATPWTAAPQASLSSLSPGVCSNSCPLGQWCYLSSSSSVVPFSSCPQSFPASGSFPVSHLFTSGGQRIGASASASILPMNIQG